jgi:signal peptidase II
MWFTITFGLIILDLFTKWGARTWFKEYVSYNPGVAFSIPIPNSIMVWLTPFLLAGIIWLVMRSCHTEHRVTKAALVLLIAGGLGNFINRIWHGAVIDFIDFSFWPSFNLADAYLTIGVFLLIGFYGKIVKK